MLYGIVGSHRSGKSTTAKRVAEDLGIEFLDSSFSVARQFGWDPVSKLSLDQRFRMQMAVLEHHVGQITAAPRPLITDRTPLDYFAYLTAEYGMLSHLEADPDLIDRASLLAGKCLEAAAAHYDMVFLLAPLPVYEADDTKATPADNRMFQTHIDMLIRGAIETLAGRLNYATVPVMKLEDRAEFICEQIIERMDEIDDLKKVAGMH